MKDFLQSRKFKVLLSAALILQTLMVLSVIDGFGYKSFNPDFRYGSDPVQVKNADESPIPYSKGPFYFAKLRYHYNPVPIIRDVSTLIIYAFLLFYFIRLVKHRKVRMGIGIFSLLIAVIAGIDARINYIATYYPDFRGPIEHGQAMALFKPKTDISPIIRIYDEQTEKEIQGVVFAIPIPVSRGPSYMGYNDFNYYGGDARLLNRFVSEDFLEYQRLWNVEPMYIRYFTWQYPGCELQIFDSKNQFSHYFDFDSRITGIGKIEFFFEYLFSRTYGFSLPLKTYAALFKYAFESPWYTTDHVDDPYFLIEKGEFRKAREKMTKIDDPAILQFLENKMKTTLK